MYLMSESLRQKRFTWFGHLKSGIENKGHTTITVPQIAADESRMEVNQSGDGET